MSKLTDLVPAGVRRRVKLQLHKGSTYTCPFCDYKSKDLREAGYDFPVLAQRQVVGGGVRPSNCWSCGSSDRERLILLYLRDELHFFDDPKSKKVLHIAPEKRLSARLLEVGADYVCGDLFTEGYKYAGHVQDMNVMDIPAADDTFDLVMCNHVLEHIVTDYIAMNELRRVLKPGGVAILQVPISKNSATTLEDSSVVDPKQREDTFGQFDHVRIYGQDYVDRLAAAGFKVHRYTLKADHAKYGVNAEEDLFLCSK